MLDDETSAFAATSILKKPLGNAYSWSVDVKINGVNLGPLLIGLLLPGSFVGWGVGFTPGDGVTFENIGCAVAGSEAECTESFEVGVLASLHNYFRPSRIVDFVLYADAGFRLLDKVKWGTQASKGFLATDSGNGDRKRWAMIQLRAMAYAAALTKQASGVSISTSVLLVRPD